MRKLIVGLVSATVLLAGASNVMAEIVIKGKNEQSAFVNGAAVNIATGANAKAKQDLSSNIGKVAIGGDNKQTTYVNGSVINLADGKKAQAEQSLASNRSE